MFLNGVHLYNYLAGIYLNTQEADAECMKFEPTDLYSYLWKVVTYQNTSILR